MKRGGSKGAYKFKFILSFEIEYRKHRTIKKDAKSLGLTMLRCSRNINKPMRNTTSHTLHFGSKKGIVIHYLEVLDMYLISGSSLIPGVPDIIEHNG